MNADDLRRYATRDWARIARLKRSRWVARRQEFGAAEGFRVAAALYHQVRDARADWPSEASRREDLTHHMELSRRLRAVGRR